MGSAALREIFFIRCFRANPCTIIFWDTIDTDEHGYCKGLSAALKKEQHPLFLYLAKKADYSFDKKVKIRKIVFENPIHDRIVYFFIIVHEKISK